MAEERDAGALMRWAVEHDVQTAPMRMRQWEEPYGWGAEATASISPPAVLVRIPLQVCLSVDTASNCSEGKAAIAEGAQGWEVIYAVLVAARAGEGEAAKRWGIYAAQLPSSPNVPLLWPSEVQRLFDGTPIGEQLQSTCSALSNLATRLRRLRWISEAALRWAYAIFWSRAMSTVGIEQGLLVPVADLINHAPTARSSYAISNDATAFELRSDDAFAAGTQIMQNYGARSDEKLLLSYGFMFPPNINLLNAASVRLSISAADPSASQKAALMSSLGLTSEQYVMQHPSLPALSSSFLQAAAVALLLEPELYLCCAKTLSLSSSHLQLRAASVLYSLLVARHAKIASSPEVRCPSELLSSCSDSIALALRYCADQRQALARGIEQTQTMLSALAAQLPSSILLPLPSSIVHSPHSFFTSSVIGDANGVRLQSDLPVDGAWARMPLSTIIPLSASLWASLLPPSFPSSYSPELLFSVIVIALRTLVSPPSNVHPSLWGLLHDSTLLDSESLVLSVPDEELSGLSLLDTRDAFLEAAAQLGAELRALRLPVPLPKAVRLMQLYEAGRGAAPGLGQYVLLQASAKPWPRPHPQAFTRAVYDATTQTLEFRTLVPRRSGEELWRNEDGCQSAAHTLLLSDICLAPPLSLPLSLDVSASQRRMLAKAQLDCDHFLSSASLPPTLLASLHVILFGTPPPSVPTHRTLRSLLQLLEAMLEAFAPSYAPHLEIFATAEQSIVRTCVDAARVMLNNTPRDAGDEEEEGKDESQEQ